MKLIKGYVWAGIDMQRNIAPVGKIKITLLSTTVSDMPLTTMLRQLKK
jgi:hypothetical protein